MFCSRCGKTLSPDQLVCPHCGLSLGESKLKGNTSAQPVYLPKEDAQEDAARYTPYTKVSYTSMNEEAEGDVYSRTAYRPVLTEQESSKVTGGQEPEAEEQQPDEAAEQAAAQGASEDRAAPAKTPEEETPSQAEESADPATGQTARRPVGRPLESPTQIEDLRRLEAVPEDAPSSDDARRIVEEQLSIRIRPVQPIKKAGISPSVQNYISQLETGKKTRKKSFFRRDEVEEPAANEAAEAAQEPEIPEEETEERPPRRKRGSTGASGRVRKILLIVLAVALVAALVFGAVRLVDNILTERSPIVGVSPDVYNGGMEMINAHTTDSYRLSYRDLYNSDTTMGALQAQQQSELAAFDALLPDVPMQNDQLFVDTLKEIQEKINDATMTDAFALSGGDASTLPSLSSYSQELWVDITNAITRLKSAATAEDLENIVAGIEMAAATPAPTATPSPEEMYTTLTKGMKNSVEVKQLQNRLYLLGWLSGKRDGDFGAITLTAVKKFQQAAGLEITGVADPQTQALLYSDNAPREGQEAYGATETSAPEDVDAALSAADAQDDAA